MGKRILLAGESWSSTTIHTKGHDSFITTAYYEGSGWLKDAFAAGGWEVTFQPNHVAARDFPMTVAELQAYDVVLLSDIGSNTLLLHPDTFTGSVALPNRCDVIRDYVLAGGGLCMVGGYLTFTGVDAKGRWGATSVKDVLPVRLLEVDDRAENPQGVVPVVTDAAHPVLRGLPAEWPAMLGYNVTKPVDGCPVLATVAGDPFVAVGEFGKGRSAVFTSDCSPHWAPPDFCNWEHYGTLWCNLANWLAKAL